MRYLIIDTKASLGLNKDNSYDQTGTFRGRFLSEEETLAKFNEIFYAGSIDGQGNYPLNNTSWDEFKKEL